MTRGNRGATRLPLRRRAGDPMRDYDSLPPELRRWLAGAVLPWAPRSARRAYARALARTGDRDRALQELDCLQARLVAKDAGRLWGPGHPCAAAGDSAARHAVAGYSRAGGGSATPA